MKRFALCALALLLSGSVWALSAYVPGATKDKEKDKKKRLQPTAGLNSSPSELRQTSSGGLSMPAETAEHTAAPTSAGGATSAGAPASAVEQEKKGTETVPVKKAPPKFRGR